MASQISRTRKKTKTAASRKNPKDGPQEKLMRECEENRSKAEGVDDWPDTPMPDGWLGRPWDREFKGLDDLRDYLRKGLDWILGADDSPLLKVKLEGARREIRNAMTVAGHLGIEVFPIVTPADLADVARIEATFRELLSGLRPPSGKAAGRKPSPKKAAIVGMIKNGDNDEAIFAHAKKIDYGLSAGYLRTLRSQANKKGKS